ncbi:MAG: 50S ribosomal protein L28 [Planctomycetota bacterium]
MAMHCEVCGKTVSYGKSISRRGKAKYLGGVGRKITGITRRQFKPNLQRIQVVVKGAVTRKRVCTQCIRSGVIQRPTIQKPFTIRSV